MTCERRNTAILDFISWPPHGIELTSRGKRPKAPGLTYIFQPAASCAVWYLSNSPAIFERGIGPGSPREPVSRARYPLMILKPAKLFTKPFRGKEFYRSVVAISAAVWQSWNIPVKDLNPHHETNGTSSNRSLLCQWVIDWYQTLFTSQKLRTEFRPRFCPSARKLPCFTLCWCIRFCEAFTVVWTPVIVFW
jgi:hypothetical protein